MSNSATPRSWHAFTASVAAVAVTLQLVLVVNGAATLLPEAQPSLVTRVVRFFSYFTILSNIAVLVTTAALARGGRHSRGWHVGRLAAVTAITVTAIVHWFLLRPLLDLSGLSLLADKLLHVVVPALAVIGWLVFGPRGRASYRDLLPALAFPIVWLLYTMAHGAATGWYPYPFLDVTDLGYAQVVVNAAGVSILLALVTAGLVWLDPRLRQRATEPVD